MLVINISNISKKDIMSNGSEYIELLLHNVSKLGKMWSLSDDTEKEESEEINT